MSSPLRRHYQSMTLRLNNHGRATVFACPPTIGVNGGGVRTYPDGHHPGMSGLSEVPDAPAPGTRQWNRRIPGVSNMVARTQLRKRWESQVPAGYTRIPRHQRTLLESHTRSILRQIAFGDPIPPQAIYPPVSDRWIFGGPCPSDAQMIVLPNVDRRIGPAPPPREIDSKPWGDHRG